MVGRAFVIVAPVSRWRVLPIPATFQQPQLAQAAALAPAPAGAARRAGRRDRSALAAVPLGFGLTGAFPLTWLSCGCGGGWPVRCGAAPGAPSVGAGGRPAGRG